jgi:dTDP-4-amino-4,6-dideoxygalactose transaminase
MAENVRISPTVHVPFVDLLAQYRTIKPAVDEALERVLARQCFVDGPETAAFEQEFADFCRAESAVAVSSGTSALELTLEALGVGPGDEVVTVAHTFIATVAAIVRRGATPVFVDVRADNWTMAPEAVADAVTERTRAIVPVHLYGHPADVPAVSEAAPSIPLIEDAAQAHGGSYHGRSVGSAATAACFSFYPTKNLGAYGDAGAVTTNDGELAKRLRQLRDHGRDVTRNDHRLVGSNARIDELQAAVLRAKLAHLPGWIEARRALAARYDDLLEPVVGVQEVSPWARHVRHLYVAIHPRRDDLVRELEERGIATGLHYPVPVHRQEAMRTHAWRAAGSLETTELLASRCLSLPLYPELAEAAVERVAETLVELSAPAPRLTTSAGRNCACG